MKQFNLKEYLANPNRKVVTGDGRNVRIICTDGKRCEYPIIALVEEPTSRFENVFSYTEGGQLISGAPSKGHDLFFAPEKHEGWINVYHDLEHNEIYCGRIYASEEEAKCADYAYTVATIKIEWEE